MLYEVNPKSHFPAMKYSFPKEKSIIVSLGGSCFSKPHGLDVEYLQKFVTAIRGYVGQGYRFIIVTGGGMVCRVYQDAARQMGKPTNADLDWVGIASTKLNAHLLRAAMSDIAHPEVIEDPTNPPEITAPVAFGSGYRPGNSSDHDAVLLAVHYGAAALINMGSADHVYNVDPKMNVNAQKIPELNWAQYAAIVPQEWQPGMNAPFDPIAAKAAEEHGLAVLITNGRDLLNFEKLISGQEGEGTLIHL